MADESATHSPERVKQDDDDESEDIGFMPTAEELTMDDVFDHVGHLGKYQWMVVIYFSCVLGGNGMIALCYLFTGRAPSLSCPVGAQGCIDDSTSDDYNVCDFDWGYALSNPNSYVQAFDLVCDQASMAGFPVSSYFVGFLVGAAAGGTAADNYGRAADTAHT